MDRQQAGSQTGTPVEHCTNLHIIHRVMSHSDAHKHSFASSSHHPLRQVHFSHYTDEYAES